MDYYKIMDRKRGNLCTLFHGTKEYGRAIPQFRFVKADVKPGVKDGTSKSTYTSGWHVIDNLQDTLDYLKSFKHIKEKVIVRCRISGKTWPKAHSPARGLVLAEYIYLCEVVMDEKEVNWYFNTKGDKNHG